MNALTRLLLLCAIFYICSCAPTPNQTDLKRMLREIAANENAYGVIQVVPYSDRLPAYMVISNQW